MSRPNFECKKLEAELSLAILDVFEQWAERATYAELIGALNHATHAHIASFLRRINTVDADEHPCSQPGCDGYCDHP